MTRLLCTGDLHLGQGQTLYPERLAEQAEVWQRIVELATRLEVDALLFAGDAFEGPLPTPEHYAAFAAPLGDLRCPLVAITGNGRHDSALRDTTAPAVIQHPFFEAHSRPALVRLDGVTIACLPWVATRRLVAAQNGGDRDAIHEHAADLLIRAARDLRDQIDGAAVLLTHFSISGAALPNGLPVDQLREPVLPYEDLAELGFDAIVAGHIHRSQDLREGRFSERLEQPPAFYVGSPLPLNFGEAGDSHGVWLLDLEQAGRGLTFLPLESRRFVTLESDLTSDDTSGLAYVDLGYAEREQPVDGAIVKVRYRATAAQARRVDHAAIRQALLDVGAHTVVGIQPDIVREARARVEGIDEQVDDVAAFRLWLDASGATISPVDGGPLPEFEGELVERHARYLEQVTT